jgi:hypothetical protein
MIHRPAG